MPGRDRSAGRGRGRGRGPGAGQRRGGRATQRKVRAVLPALPRSESAPRSCPRCSPRPARSPFLCAHPRSSLPGPPPGSAFVVRLGCRARGSRVRAVAPRDLGQRVAGPSSARAGAQAGGLCALPSRPSRVPRYQGHIAEGRCPLAEEWVNKRPIWMQRTTGLRNKGAPVQPLSMPRPRH